VAVSSKSPRLSGALLSNAPTMITTATAPYMIVHTNRAWSALTGYQFLEVAGKSPAFLQGPATSRKEIAEMSSALKNGQSFFVELINYTRDGTPFANQLTCQLVAGGSHFMATLSVTPITDGNVPALERAHLQAIRAPLAPMDYSDPQRYEHAAKRTRRSAGNSMRANSAIANTTDGVLWAPDDPHVITHPNQVWLEMCGCTLEAVAALSTKIITGVETDASAIASLLRCVSRHEPSALPLYDESADIAGFTSMLREVSKQPCNIHTLNRASSLVQGVIETSQTSGM